MLREEIRFRIKMRNSLAGIRHLDPGAITPRLERLDGEIAELEARVAAEEPAPAMEVVRVGAAVRAA